MKTVLQSSTRHGVVDEIAPHSSVRSFLVADYCDHDGYKRFMVPTFYFANPIMDEKYFVHVHDVEWWMKQSRIHPREASS